LNRVRAVVFDAYGTLLDIHAAMARHAERLGPDWPAISGDWRAKQIEYTWVRSLAGPAQHRDFWRLTEEALAWTAARHHIRDTVLLADILLAYRHLDVYPEVPVVLRQLRDLGLPRAILSNAEPGMLRDAVAHAGIDTALMPCSAPKPRACSSPILGSIASLASISAWPAARWPSSRPIHGMRSAPMPMDFACFG
jgi:2-haloalkanoic acid dehalogenase type II